MSDAQPSHLHQSHHAIVKRLKRATGQLAGVIEMIGAGRSCMDVAQQLHALEKAIAEAKRALVRDHLDHCLEAVTGPLPTAQRRVMDEMKTISRYL